MSEMEFALFCMHISIELCLFFWLFYPMCMISFCFYEQDWYAVPISLVIPTLLLPVQWVFCYMFRTEMPEYMRGWVFGGACVIALIAVVLAWYLSIKKYLDEEEDPFIAAFITVVVYSIAFVFQTYVFVF